MLPTVCGQFMEQDSGCRMTNVERRKWDWRNVRDFDWLSNPLPHELFEFEGGDQMCVNTGTLGLE